MKNFDLTGVLRAVIALGIVFVLTAVSIQAQAEDNFDQAIFEYTEILKLKPKDASVYLARALAYFKKNEIEKSLADLNTAIELDAKISGAYLLRGQVFEKKSVEETSYIKLAIADFTTVIKLDPKAVEAYTSRGIIYQRFAYFKAAAADFGKAVGLEPDKYVHYVNRGLAYRWNSDYDAAIADYTRAIKIVEKTTVENQKGVLSTLFADLAFTFGLNGDDLRAESNYDKAFELNPSDIDLCRKIAVYYSDRNEIRKSIGFWTKAIELIPVSAADKPDMIYHNRGYNYLKIREFDKAIADFTKAINLNGREMHYFWRGSVYYQKGDFTKALSDFTRVIELDSLYAKAYKARADVYRRLGKNDLAEADEKRADEADDELLRRFREGISDITEKTEQEQQELEGVDKPQQ